MMSQSRLNALIVHRCQEFQSQGTIKPLRVPLMFLDHNAAFNLKLKTFRLVSLIVENFHVTHTEARDSRLEKVRGCDFV